MSNSLWNTVRPRFSLSASALTQLLSAFACFLAAFVLPNTMAEFRGATSSVLIVLGFIAGCIGIVNLFYGRHIARLLTRAGKRSRVVVPREGVGYLTIMLALAVGALMGHRNMPLLVFGMMAGPFILNGAIVYQMLRRIDIKRRMPQRTLVGDSVLVEFELKNNKRWIGSHMLEVRDRISDSASTTVEADADGIITFLRVPAGTSRTGRYEMSFERRGKYKLGPVRVSSRFPIGIGERGQVFDDRAEMIVRPQLGRLLPQWDRQQKELAESSQLRQRTNGIFDDEFHRIREYRDGDNPRSIHWRSTARRGQLMIREHHQHRQSDAILILHLPEIAEWSRQASEIAISMAATMCVTQTKSASGSRFLLMVVGAQTEIIETRHPAGFREDALDCLAMCQRSKKAKLQNALTTLMNEHGIAEERVVLMTPQPQKAKDALRAVSNVSSDSESDLLHHTTIVETTIENMEQIFQRDSSSFQSSNLSLAAETVRQAAAPSMVETSPNATSIAAEKNNQQATNRQAADATAAASITETNTGGVS